MDSEFWARVLGIIVIDLTLAGDNALVIALAALLIGALAFRKSSDRIPFYI